MEKKTTLAGVALATILATAGCASADQQADTRDGSTISVTEQDGGAFTIEREPGDEGGLRIPRQKVTPTGGNLNYEPQAGGEGALEDTSLKVEPVEGSSGFIISRDPGEEGGLFIQEQLVVPFAKRHAEEDEPAEPPPEPEM
ncbi:MAG: hypothetical protein KDI90_10535 [Alphaproteobacteria bacterium]|nr:hypothetical protein [Alphaproteobacteria bacterium]MCB9975640.1 hypothetical protein [Rhodospirillales bacterium]